jgi:hypothetical protein
MAQSRRSRLRQAAFLTLGVAFSGCAAGQPPELLPPEYVRAEFQPGDEIPVMSESHIDSLNRYLSTAAITTPFQVPGAGTDVRTCSGELIHSRAVLTAGHCVCHERRPVPPESSDMRLIDKSTCAKMAVVRFFRYETEGDVVGDATYNGDPSIPFIRMGPYSGRVQVHEGIRILYKEVESEAGVKISAESSVADLAIILLDEPAPDTIKPARLAENPARLKERVLMVGYGTNSLGTTPQEPVRRYGTNEVISIREDGATFYVGRQYEIEPIYRGEKPGVFRAKGSYTEKGDSGGPCFRERKGGLELVGIAKSTLSPPVVLSSYTSVPKYLDWIRQKIEEADNSN